MATTIFLPNCDCTTVSSGSCPGFQTGWRDTGQTFKTLADALPTFHHREAHWQPTTTSSLMGEAAQVSIQIEIPVNLCHQIQTQSQCLITKPPVPRSPSSVKPPPVTRMSCSLLRRSTGPSNGPGRGERRGAQWCEREPEAARSAWIPTAGSRSFP